MRWTVTLQGTETDIARLVDNLPDRVRAVDADPLRAVVTLIDPEGDDSSEAAREAIESLVTRLNGVAKLRWGRAFAGVENVAHSRTGPDGTDDHVVFAPVAKCYLTYEEFVRFLASQGRAAPGEPDGLADVNSISLGAVVSLAETDAAAASVFRLVDLALSGQHDIDWVLAYATLEVVAADATARGADGKTLGWWTKREWSDFGATANSPIALGVRARHGASLHAVPARMSDTDATWFLRRVVARWAAWRMSVARSGG